MRRTNEEMRKEAEAQHADNPDVPEKTIFEALVKQEDLKEKGVVTSVRMILNNPQVFAAMNNESLACNVYEDVYIATYENGGDVQVQIGYTNEKGDDSAILFDLHTFLNIGRMLAMHHKAVLGAPEARTDDNVPSILVPGAGHG